MIAWLLIAGPLVAAAGLLAAMAAARIADRAEAECRWADALTAQGFGAVALWGGSLGGGTLLAVGLFTAALS
jgi:hypothetical protein